MKDLCRLIWSGFVGLLRSRSVLATENLVLRQQINVLQRTAPRRLSFNCLDRLIFVGLYRLFPDVRDALAIVKPDTVSVGIVRDSEPTGVGSRDLAAGGLRWRWRYVG